MAGDDWQDFAGSVEVESGRKPLPLPGDAALDQFEARTGFRLPDSYRSFIKTFGPGSLAYRFRITAPGDPKRGPRVDLDALRDDFVSVTSDGELEESYDDPERARRLVLFCLTTGEDFIGWDPREATDPGRHEYAVYEVPRGDDKLHRLAGTFREFVEDYCLGDLFLQTIGGEWDEDALGPRRVYTRA